MNSQLSPHLPRCSSSRITTPLVAVSLPGWTPKVWCKLKYLNPSGSTKDRIARYILTKAIRQGALPPSGIVVEASSGSTSIAMALACAQLGLTFVAVMPAGVSDERVMMIRAYGAEVELTPKPEGIAGAINRAQNISANRIGPDSSPILIMPTPTAMKRLRKYLAKSTPTRLNCS